MTASRDHKTNPGGRYPRYIFKISEIPHLPEAEKIRLEEITRFFDFRANEYYLNLIDWENPDDPIRRLVIPNESELNEWGDLDACNEKAITVRKGIQHKYPTTVLMLVNEVCASFCRYCFRKRIFMNGNDEITYDMNEAVEYIRNHPEVNNVLLTGGDPLMLPTRRLEKIITALRKIEHVRIIRIGTKMPAFNPFRFINDPELLQMFAKYSLPDNRMYLICHFDHPRELTPQAREAIRLVQEAGVITCNQNPIIKGISDCPTVLAELWNELSFMGVPQYYVFQGRPTAGNDPFKVPLVETYFKIEEAKKKCSGLSKRLKFVMSHATGKIEIVGVDEQFIYLKYHRAPKYVGDHRFIVCYRNDQVFWFDQLEPVQGFDDLIPDGGFAYTGS